MKLWTFQTEPAVAQLQREGILQTDWQFVAGEKWQTAFRWMIRQMEDRGIHCAGFAPVWAWHSCERYGRGPTLGTASSLLFGFQLDQGVKTIEFNCPDELALLSRYGPWNDVLFQFLDGAADVNLSPRKYRQLFRVIDKGRQEYQATLPYLQLEWVQDIRDLPFTSSEDDCDWDAMA